MFLKVEPHSSKYREEDVLFIDLDKHSIDGLKLANRLKQSSMNWDDIFHEALEDAPDPGDEKGREELVNRTNEEIAAVFVELLNFVLGATGKEIATNSEFEIVPTDEIDKD